MFKMAPYLCMAKVAGEEKSFYEIFFKVWFERWPEMPTNNSDSVEDLMKIVKKIHSNTLMPVPVAVPTILLF